MILDRQIRALQRELDETRLMLGLAVQAAGGTVRISLGDVQQGRQIDLKRVDCAERNAIFLRVI